MHEFTADLWRSSIEGAAWYFVTLPEDLSDEIEAASRGGQRKGFGSVRVTVRVGRSTWATSLFPDSTRGAYVLPVKKAVRRAENLEEGETVTVALAPIDDESAVPEIPAPAAASATPAARTSSHAQMFDDDDPMLARVRALALALPDAAEKISHGRPAFFTKKVFCYYGGSLKIDGEWVQHPQSIMVLPDPAERHALLQDDRTFVPAYLGGSGWIGVRLVADTDWQEVAELLEDSYRQTASRSRVARLNTR